MKFVSWSNMSVDGRLACEISESANILNVDTEQVQKLIEIEMLQMNINIKSQVYWKKFKLTIHF